MRAAVRALTAAEEAQVAATAPAAQVLAAAAGMEAEAEAAMARAKAEEGLADRPGSRRRTILGTNTQGAQCARGH